MDFFDDKINKMNFSFQENPKPIDNEYYDRILIGTGSVGLGLNFAAIVEQPESKMAFHLRFIKLNPNKDVFTSYQTDSCNILNYNAQWSNRRFTDVIHVRAMEYKGLGFGRLAYRVLVHWFGTTLYDKLDRGGCYFDDDSDNYATVIHHPSSVALIDAVKQSFSAKMYREYLHLVPSSVNMDLGRIYVEFEKETDKESVARVISFKNYFRMQG